MHLRRTPATSAEGRSALLRVRRLVLSRHRASHGVFLFRVVVPYNLSSRVLNQLWRIICNSEEDLVLANRVGKTECIKLVCHCWPRICQKNLVQKEQLTVSARANFDLNVLGARVSTKESNAEIAVNPSEEEHVGRVLSSCIRGRKHTVVTAETIKALDGNELYASIWFRGSFFEAIMEFRRGLFLTNLPENPNLLLRENEASLVVLPDLLMELDSMDELLCSLPPREGFLIFGRFVFYKAHSLFFVPAVAIPYFHNHQATSVKLQKVKKGLRGQKRKNTWTKFFNPRQDRS
ncbi:hypothetical protein JHK85_016789 [Glycine max]|nr:hypothetical protein JHK85_016789 [Glycine max]